MDAIFEKQKESGMLELKDITKVYPAGGDRVEALKGISLQFRRSEFVSILGPSGCGKTTLLNIIGGLDQYSSGDLVINGTSTRDYQDRDWDAYRNHSIGFVFQSYNLIPHQSVLQNVELALTLSGVSRLERRKRAVDALERVGLGDQLRKRPNEMSGGQMQRVAIARAIVNNPDIVLADEPTGALDTATSVQVMEILKEISRDRLVIMVTHNPELAEKYSTRIIRMLDGKSTSDSMPLTDSEIRAEDALSRKTPSGVYRKIPSMNLRTAFGLSLKNLFTKKGRTILTSFAGSIGIIGIALIYAVSNGMTAYIDKVQEDTLSTYPLTLEAQHMDASSMLSTFLGKAESATEHPDDGVYQKAMLYELLNAMNSMEAQENDLKSFRSYLETARAEEDGENLLKSAVSGVQYTYDNEMVVYTKNVDGRIIPSDMQALIRNLMGSYMQTDFSAMTSLMSEGMTGTQSAMMNSRSMWREMLPGEDGRLISPLFEKQYDLVYGAWPSRYDEVLLVVDEDGELPDLTLYALGLLPQENIEALMRSALTRQPYEYSARGWSYEEICALEFRVILSADCFVRDVQNGGYMDLRSTEAGIQYLYDNGLPLKVCGIVRPAAGAVATMISRGVAYTSALTQYLVEKGNASEAVQAQLASPGTDILTGLPFREGNAMTADEKAEAFRAYLAGMEDSGKSALYDQIMRIPPEDTVNQAVQDYLGMISRQDMEGMMRQSLSEQTGMDSGTIGDYLSSRPEEAISDMLSQVIAEQVKKQYVDLAGRQLARMSDQEKAAELGRASGRFTDAECALYYDQVMTFSDSTLEKNLKKLGYVDLESPSMMYLYAATFADKDRIEQAIAEYNAGVDDMEEIQYTDYVGLIMSSVTTIINAITYVLIAFVAISLVVSSIMIGVITLISVQERTREIGVLRSIGASKRNVSSMFTAETVIIGFASGTMGVCITALLCIPINAILHSLTGIHSLSAFLDIRVALALILISMFLNLLAGVIPSRSAAKKDPVVALRTE